MAKSKHTLPFRILRALLLFVGGLLLVVVSAAVFLWFRPGTLVTSERVSHLSEKALRPRSTLPPGTLPVKIAFSHPDWRTLAIQIELAPACWDIGDAKDLSKFCTEEARIALAVRLHRKPYLQLAWIGPISLKVSSIELHTSSSEPKPKKKEKKPPEPFDPTKYLSHIAKDFHWETILVDIRSMSLPDINIQGSAKIETESVQANLDTLKILAEAKSFSKSGSGWTGKLEGVAKSQGHRVTFPRITGSYRIAGKRPTRIDGEVSALFDFDKTEAKGTFDARWNKPFDQVHSLQIDGGTVTAGGNGFDVGGTVKLVPEAISDVGSPPVLSLRAHAAMNKKTGHQIAYEANIDSYQFAGFELASDLEFSMETGESKERFHWKKGHLRIGTKDFSKVVYALRKTSIAVPAPFAILKGTLLFETDPFHTEKDHLFISGKLRTDLHSNKQAVVTETKVDLILDSNELDPKGLEIAAQINNLRLVMPDYDPIAPPPIIGSDPRIIREKPKTLVAENPGVLPKEKNSFPMKITVESPPAGIGILSKYANPEVAGEVHLAIDSEKPPRHPGALMGSVQISRPFTVDLLKRPISVDKLIVKFRPVVEIESTISMERAGYHVQADFTQIAGHSKVILSSVPLLSDDEIVSLMLYGIPRTSVTSDQDSSVGSVQAAISSNALGIFSLWALASTPIETVMYDPETKTYSAVVKLPGGVVGSIGNSWENDKQVALSKSLGRNWAISTELIQDVNGVNRVGTMLRWRKRY